MLPTENIRITIPVVRVRLRAYQSYTLPRQFVDRCMRIRRSSDQAFREVRQTDRLARSVHSDLKSVRLDTFRAGGHKSIHRSGPLWDSRPGRLVSIQTAQRARRLDLGA